MGLDIGVSAPRDRRHADRARGWAPRPEPGRHAGGRLGAGIVWGRLPPAHTVATAPMALSGRPAWSAHGPDDRTAGGAVSETVRRNQDASKKRIQMAAKRQKMPDSPPGANLRQSPAGRRLAALAKRKLQGD